MSHVYKQAGTLCEVWKSITKSTEKQKKRCKPGENSSAGVQLLPTTVYTFNKAQRRLPQEVHQT